MAIQKIVVIEQIESEDATWRIVSVDHKIYVENVFPTEYTEWHRFTQWGSFKSVAHAAIAVRLASLADYDNDAREALKVILRRNVGFKGL